MPSKKKLKRGQVYHIAADPKHPSTGAEIWAERPGVIISTDELLNTSSVVTIAYCTTRAAKHITPLHVPCTFNKQDGVVLTEQIVTVDRSRIKDYLGNLPPSVMNNVDAACKMALGLDKANFKALFYKWERYVKEHHLELTKSCAEFDEHEQDSIIETLKAQLDLAIRERDAYRELYESGQIRSKTTLPDLD